MAMEDALVAGNTSARFQRDGDVDTRSFCEVLQDRDHQSYMHVFPDFPKKLMTKLDAQRKQSVMCDVTIITKDGQPFRAHKAVLAASSRYLEAELYSIISEKSKGMSEAVIHLGMISAVGFGILLDLVYTSKLLLSVDNVTEVLLAADVLDLHEVSAICREFLRSIITSKSVPCDKRRSESSSSSLHSDTDVNNNILSRPYHKKFRHSPSNTFERGVSEESTSSSSGVSSCSSKESQSGGEWTMEFPHGVNPDTSQILDKPEVTLQRCGSLGDMPALGLINESVRKRPISAPAAISESGGSCDPNPSDARQQSQSRSKRENCGRVRKSSNHHEVQGHTHSRNHGLNGSCSETCDQFETIASREVTPGETSIVFADEPAVSRKGLCQVKTEHQNNPEAISSEKYRMNEAGRFEPMMNDREMPDQECDNLTMENPDDVLSFRKHMRADERDSDLGQKTRLHFDGDSGRGACGIAKFSAVTSVSTPPPIVPVRSVSYDDSNGGQPGYVDLNSTQYTKSAEKEGKLLRSPYGRRSMHEANTAQPLRPNSKVPFTHTSSFLASLYMLSSQGANAASFLSTTGLQRDPTQGLMMDCYGSGSLPPPFARRQLQHSHSVVSSGALLCKLCRLEFTSEWALSMHYRLYHPLNYLYQPRLLSAKQGQMTNASSEKGCLAEKTSPSSLPPPLTRSTSSPCRFATTENRERQLDQNCFGSESLNSLALASLPPVTHKCYHCKKEFSSIFLLRKHKSIEHMKRPFKCHRCDSAFPNKAGLSVHLRSHTGERPYRCKVCNKAFTQLGHVQRHQKVHTGEKPYQCPLCQARVRDKASMHYHILAHQGVKPFKCDQCDARFTKRSSLVKHKNVHTGAFLYQCPQCKASFREKASLSRHVRSQHKDPCFTVSGDYASSMPLESRIAPKETASENSSDPVDLTMEVVKVV